MVARHWKFEFTLGKLLCILGRGLSNKYDRFWLIWFGITYRITLWTHSVAQPWNRQLTSKKSHNWRNVPSIFRYSWWQKCEHLACLAGGIVNARKVLEGELRSREENGEETLWNFLSPSALAFRGKGAKMAASRTRKNNSARYTGFLASKHCLLQ